MYSGVGVWLTEDGVEVDCNNCKYCLINLVDFETKVSCV